MNFKIIFIGMLIGSSGIALAKEYPYQKPHRFNTDYAAGQYILSGINCLNLSPEIKSILISWGNNIKRCTKENGYVALDLNLDQNALVHINDEIRDNKGIIQRKIQRTGSTYSDQFIVYLYNKAKNTGSKLIFDIDKFEKYLSQTWDYDHLNSKKWIREDLTKPGKKLPDMGAVQLSFSFNTTSFDFTDQQKPNQLIKPEDLLKVVYQKTDTCRSYAGNTWDCYQIFPITNWIKMKPGEDTINVTYEDLYKEKIIQVLSMSPEEVKQIF